MVELRRFAAEALAIHHEHRDRDLESARGLALLAPGLVAFLYGMSEAGNRGGFGSARPLVGTALGLALVAATSHLYRVDAVSMEPALRPGDRVLVPRWWFRVSGPQRGDVIAFHAPTEARLRCGSAGLSGLYVQRIVALPGERWRERHGIVFVDGRRLRERYVHGRDAESFPGGRVPTGEYLLLGDNRRRTCDSRVYGVVPRGAFVGRVVVVYWPPGHVNLR
jgi:signal peptidase I